MDDAVEPSATVPSATEPSATVPTAPSAPEAAATASQPPPSRAPSNQVAAEAPASTADDLTTLDAAERLLDDVDHALRRLEAGTFGSCEACGEPIGEERLLRLPTARTCEDHPQLTDDAVAP